MDSNLHAGSDPVEGIPHFIRQIQQERIWGIYLAQRLWMVVFGKHDRGRMREPATAETKYIVCVGKDFGIPGRFLPDGPDLCPTRKVSLSRHK
jgi:hypothetical protein